MTSREFSEWQAYTAHEPIGMARLDRHMAVLAATIVNMLRDPKKPGVTAQDFLDDFANFWPDPLAVDADGNEIYSPEEIEAAENALIAWAKANLGEPSN